MKTIPTEAKVVFAVIAAILLAVGLMIVLDNGQDDTPRRSKAVPATTWQKTSEGGNIVPTEQSEWYRDNRPSADDPRRSVFDRQHAGKSVTCPSPSMIKLIDGNGPRVFQPECYDR